MKSDALAIQFPSSSRLFSGNTVEEPPEHHKIITAVFLSNSSDANCLIKK